MPGWWLAWRDSSGELRRESSGSVDRQAAERALRARLALVDRGTPAAPEATTFDDLAAIVRADYQANGRRSAKRLDQSLAHLERAFSGQRAATLTADRLTRYAADRLEAGAARATVNRELAALRRAFRLAHRAGRVAAVPHVAMLREANARRGFLERDAFERVRGHLPAPERLLVLVAYTTGWRIASELLTRQWRHLDLDAGWLRLEPNETKSGRGRQFPLTPELRRALREQKRTTAALERATRRVIPWIFHRSGAPIRTFRRAWLTACRAAGVPDSIPHDFRRTATRNMIRAGVPQAVVMAAIGWETDSVFRRYAIVDEVVLREAGAKLARLRR